MSAMPTDEPAAQDQATIDSQIQQLQQQHVPQDVQLAQAQQQQIPQPQQQSATPSEPTRKPKAPSVRRACVACHTGKTRCSEVLPCQSCLKRGLGASCAYPDPDAQNQQQQQQDHHAHHTPAPGTVQFAPPPMYASLQAPPNMAPHQQYYDYSNAFAASTSTFRPNKRPRNLTEEEAAAITRNFSRGDFFVGSSAPVRIDPRLPVRLTLGEGDHVHFTVGEPLV
ncbi:transcription factor [Coprinopsis cinerea AmutBmut pab1-1]|nr:transcription factor [Coprinopsis cinerea AmutBmut pab1-1]